MVVKLVREICESIDEKSIVLKIKTELCELNKISNYEEDIKEYNINYNEEFFINYLHEYYDMN